MKLAVKVTDCKVCGCSHNRTACNMLRRLFCSQLANQTSVNKKVRESRMNLTGVLSSAVQCWWVSCLTASNQPAAPWQSTLCMTHHMEHVILHFMHTHTHTHTHTHAVTFICKGLSSKTLKAILPHRKGKPFVFVCRCVHVHVPPCLIVYLYYGQSQMCE